MGNLHFGIDLGSNNLKVYCKEGDRIIQQKNMVAVENKKNMIAYGDEAYAMYEKAPAHIEVSYPMSYGNIGSINNLELFLKALLEKTTKGALKGASAVIEKDAIAGKLAADLETDELIILTSVDNVYLNFEKESQEAISSMTVEEAKAAIADGQFEAGTMLPKIEAAIYYLEKVPHGKVLITSMKAVKDAVKGKAGTIITA